jgi:hypothetical protein
MPPASSGRLAGWKELKNKQTKIKNDYETAKSCKHNPTSEMRFGLQKFLRIFMAKK